ncbi:UpxY family transcription antiterminator [Halosquirtibacter laminarini]|uniref:UpxY family transcription antiterminator n=1 Tax=Halosquirtibacter laminarini TaxID=3374600 RepID=A0AC61NM87_9BACT|nr:UpxY family transcription antiterminator [Prolixibacteraceae bacterium]
MKKWYAVYVRSRSEKKVGEALTSMGIENYIPLRKEWRQWSDRKKIVEVPVLCGYIFVKADLKERLEVLKCNNIVAFVRHNGKDAEIRSRDIDALKCFLEQTGVSVEQTSERIMLGSTVEVLEGPFVGYIGEMVRHNGKHKVIVRLEALQSNILVEVELEHIIEAQSV